MNEQTVILDSKGHNISIDDTFVFNGKNFFIKYSETQKSIVARVVNDKGMNWRDLDWIKRVAKYIEITGKLTL